MAETEKAENEKQNKFLINPIGKTIAENYKVLAEFGMAPAVHSKIKSVLTMNLFTNSNDEILQYDERNNINENNC